MKTFLRLAVAGAVVAGLAAPAQAQAPGVTRTELQRHDLGVPGREAVQVIVALAPGATVGPHTHPGEEIIYVQEGRLQYAIKDRPPVTLGAGEVLFIPAGVVHAATNVGTVRGAELSTYVVQKGKPLSSPAP